MIGSVNVPGASAADLAKVREAAETAQEAAQTAGLAAELAREELVQLSADIATERARINNLATLTEGSTTGDAELQDVRTGYDGAVYDNAGEAVRNQISDARTLISEYCDVKRTRNLFNKNAQFRQLAIDATTLAAGSNAKARMALIPIEPEKTYTITAHISGYFVMGLFDTEDVSAGTVATYRTEGLSTIADDATGRGYKYITTTESTKALGIMFWYNTSSETMTIEEKAASLQVEEGGRYTEYVPHTIPGNDPAVVNIETLGAIGDGVFNNYSIIQSAIDTYSGKKTILIPQGTFLCYQTLTLRKNTRIVGVDQKTSVVYNPVSTVFCADTTIENHYWSIENLTVRGDRSATTNGVITSLAASPQTFYYSTILKNVRIENCVTGVRAHYKSHLPRIESVFVVECDTGVWWEATDGAIHHLLATSCSTGLKFGASGCTRFSDSKIYWNDDYNILCQLTKNHMWSNIEAQDSANVSVKMVDCNGLQLNSVQINDSGYREETAEQDAFGVALTMENCSNIRGSLHVSDYRAKPTTAVPVEATGCENVKLMYTEENIAGIVGEYEGVTLI